MKYLLPVLLRKRSCSVIDFRWSSVWKVEANRLEQPGNTRGPILPPRVPARLLRGTLTGVFSPVNKHQSLLCFNSYPKSVSCLFKVYLLLAWSSIYFNWFSATVSKTFWVLIRSLPLFGLPLSHSIAIISISCFISLFRVTQQFTFLLRRCPSMTESFSWAIPKQPCSLSLLVIIRLVFLARLWYFAR